MKSLRLFGTYKFGVLAGLLSIGTSAMASSELTVSALNQGGGTLTGYINDGSGNVDVYIGSMNGKLVTGTLTQTLGEFYCVDITHSINLPTSYSVNPTSVNSGTLGEAAWLIENYSPGYNGTTVGSNYSAELSGHTQAEVDSALQLAIWETVFPSMTYQEGGPHADSKIAGMAASMITADGGKTYTAYELTEINNDGQSMMYIPGGGNPNPPSAAPEPITIALGIAGLGMAIRRRFVK